ncbi:hypothetical protein R1flu_013069 [Riccia fluitans]|uniref:ABC transporter n=1 Tax=Riccia fluitans TaxID=41844 RepID=A0ABD1ZGF5_9MARC
MIFIPPSSFRLTSIRINPTCLGQNNSPLEKKPSTTSIFTEEPGQNFTIGASLRLRLSLKAKVETPDSLRNFLPLTSESRMGNFRGCPGGLIACTQILRLQSCLNISNPCLKLVPAQNVTLHCPFFVPLLRISSCSKTHSTRGGRFSAALETSFSISPFLHSLRNKPSTAKITGRQIACSNSLVNSFSDFAVDLPLVKDHDEVRPKTGGTNLFPLSPKTLKILIPFMYPQLPIILRGWFCTFVSVACLYLFVPQIGHMSNLLSQGNLIDLGRKMIWVVLIVGVKSVAQFWQQALLWESALNITFSVRSHVFKRVLDREMSFFEGQRAAAAGDLAFRITSEAEDMGDTIFSLLQMMVPSALQLVAMATRMITLNPILALATFSVVPCMGIVIAMLGEKLRKIARKGQDSIANLSAYLNEVLQSMFVVKAHAAENLELWRFQKLAGAEQAAHLGKKRMKAFIPEMITLVYVVTAMVLFGVGTWAIAKGTFDGGGMVSFITSLILLVEPMQALGKAYNELKNGEPAIERLFELAHQQPEVLAPEECKPLVNVAGEVELSGVFFRYSDELPWVIKNISLNVVPGETVALVGGSGSGKSTLAKLLLRLYDPVQGTITVDGQDIRRVTKQSLRQHMAIVPQETTLFTGTVAENIAYGTMPEEIDLKAVVRAAELANADEFISKLPNGYHTKLGDRASSLSGGQRQRLAIARAIYQDATILILDEATSALDNKSEKLVREALERLMYGRTVFVIAHRLETVERADRIVVLDGGTIVEEGTHESLLSQGGKYAALYTRRESTMGVADVLT